MQSDLRQDAPRANAGRGDRRIQPDAARTLARAFAQDAGNRPGCGAQTRLRNFRPAQIGWRRGFVMGARFNAGMFAQARGIAMSTEKNSDKPLITLDLCGPVSYTHLT